MVSVDREDEVDAGSGKQRIVSFGENHFNVSDVFLLCLLCEEISHVWIDIHGVDSTRGTYGFRESEGKVTPAGSQISDVVTGPNIERLDDALRLLPFATV